MASTYKLSLTTRDGVLLNTWVVTANWPAGVAPDPEAYEITKRIAQVSVMQEIVNEIETAEENAAEEAK